MAEEPVEKRHKTTRVPPQHVYLEAAMYVRQTGTSFRKAAEKYNINYVTLRRFCGKLSNETNGGLGVESIGIDDKNSGGKTRFKCSP